MAFKYSCFISYRRLQHRLVESFVITLKDALSKEIEPYTKLPIFLSTEKSDCSDYNEEPSAKALCQSMCMIVVFTPIYFSKTDTYCAREFKAMKLLESERLGLLPDSEIKNLIIPIILRGNSLLPEEVRERKPYYDFSDSLLIDDKFTEGSRFKITIQEIGSHVKKCFDKLSPWSGVLLQDCEDFQLPREDEISLWLDSIATGRDPFPFPLR